MKRNIQAKRRLFIVFILFVKSKSILTLKKLDQDLANLNRYRYPKMSWTLRRKVYRLATIMRQLPINFQ